MGSGELVSREQLARWRERGLIRFFPLRRGIAPVRAPELAHSPVGAFTGLAPLHEDHDVVRGERTHATRPEPSQELVATQGQHPRACTASDSPKSGPSLLRCSVSRALNRAH